jgi:hypothetical protein
MMKKFYKLIFVSAMLLLSQQAWAQKDYTLYSIGFIGGQKTTPSTGNTYSYSSGHVGSTAGYVGVVPGETYVYTGFPYNVLYFKNVFEKQIFVSKGYFADYVQLQWNVVSLANSIKRFKIYRKQLGDPGDSLLMASVPADNYSWKDEYAERGIIYEYTVFAEGLSDKLRLPFINIMQGSGFAMPTGRASGRVTFEGGTAVEGVAVLAETEGSLSGKSQFLNGTDAYFTIPHLQNDTELEIRDGFTFQAWCKWDGASKGTIFSKGTQYDLSIENDKISFKVNDATVILPFVQPVDTFFHISAVYKPAGDLALYVHINDERIDSAKVAAGTQPTASVDNIILGKNSGGNFFKGNMDEIRLWNQPLNYTAIKNNYSRYINGTETGLAGYWRMNEGIGNQFYDFARKGFTFYENHAFISNGQWSAVTPLRSQLAFRGITDASGNYTISGFPYETDGSLYKFTPTFEVHQFDPNQQIRLISNETSVINELNFKDISSFLITGTVRYRNTTFPVEAVNILVDGKPATNSDAQLITTDNLGRFSVSVPIGKHNLRVSLNGHTFDDGGRFPAPTSTIPAPLFDFQKPISGLEFIDTTLVKVAGRVTGGPVEAGKILGFGKSKNNLGNAVINLTTEKGFDISLSDSTKNYSDEEHIVSSANFKTKNVKVFPDDNTGEFVAYLLPEKYKVTGITAGNYIFGADFNITVNLKDAVKNNKILKDTLGATVKGIPLSYPPFNPLSYDSIFNSISGDTTWKIGVDTFFFQREQNFIYRTTPTLTVLNKDGEELFGDEEFKYNDPVLNVKETIPLIVNGAYTFGHPVFNDRQTYNMFIDLFEEYTNVNTGVTSKVPVTDGRIEIVNNLAMSSDKVTLSLNEKGKALYRFNGGLPEINVDNITPGNSYTKTLNITAFSGNNGAIQTIWRQSDPLRGFLLSGMPIGTNFVTTGPTQVVTILRDPPGSSSKAYLEQGQTKSTTTTWNIEDAFSQEANVKFKLGQTVKVFAGVGAGTITETEFDHDVTIGWNSEEKWLSDNEKAFSVTTTQRWETSDQADYVGDKADVFVGYASNIVYGISAIVDIIPQTSCTNCIPGNYPASSGNFSIGLKNGLRLNPEISAGFMHTQGHIQDVILPSLKELRNSFLVYSPNPSSVAPKVVTSPSDEECSKNAIYVSLVPITDERFGSSNLDTVVWANQAVRSNVNLGNGPSYKIITAQGCASYYTKDTIQYFNQQIKDWIFWLAKNEQEKAEATEEIENLAFDAGAVFEKSVAVDRSETSTQTYEWSVSPSVSTTLGFSFNKFGLEVSGKLAYGHTRSDQTGSSASNTTTYGYVLGESESTDYYSVNVRKADDGFGPVFRINGGVTSCPYQGESHTEFYLPNGKPVVLSPATVAVDAPLLEMEQNIAADIASNRAAEFNLLLKNNSGSQQDRWYTLTVDDNTNPYGAVLEIDGTPIGNGRSFLVKAGETLQKTLKVRMGREDVMTYEDIRLLFSSQCEESIADDAFLSVFFVPGCSDIIMDLPKASWVMNTNNTPVDSLLVNLIGYNRDHENFKHILFQYKPSGSSLWTTDMVFYNPTNVTQAEYDAAQQPKQWITDAATLYYWDMHSQPDRNYDIRAKTICELGPATFVETPTDIISGIKDVKRPVVFGSPQPADGVLSAGEDIAVQFDETIEASLLTPFNFSVQAVLNGYPLNHNTSVKLDGINDQVTMAEGLNLGNSYTVEFWLRRNDMDRRQVVFSKGNDASDRVEIGFTADNKLFVMIGQQEITTSRTFLETDWQHFALAYDATNKTVSAYKNDVFILENVSVLGAFTGAGPIELGQSLFSASDLYQGNIHELRIWSKFLQLGDVYASMSLSLSGNEIGLVGYWPFDEARGNLAHDKARFRHATVNADWLVLPEGRSYEFDGVDDYLDLNTGSTVIISNEMDFTIEFWFRGTPGQKNVTMFSSGKGDGSDAFNKGSWSVGFNSSGQLQVASNGIFLTADNGVGLLDDDWHHVAVSVNRKGNTNLFVDGTLSKSQASSGFGPFYGAHMWLGARGFKTGTLTTQFDRYFQGNIDEFRVWKLCRKQNQVELAINAKLSGDEAGLVAYYPFEFYTTTQGIKILNPSSNDQWINPNGPNGGTAVALGGADFSTVTPNIKDSRPVQKVDFTWAVNNDKIIITTSPNMAAAIEKTLLEITLSNVEDKYENRIVSPITWTAFIDRNQMKWGDDVINLEKTLYNPLTFSVEVTNHGGTEQNFVINNLPSWLSASASSGIIPALTTITVTFTVDEGLNTGIYQEDLYLKSDFGYDEKLIINLRNYTPVPDSWKVDPDKFQYSMNIDGMIRFNGKLSDNPYDHVAVFVGDECRGVANLQYVKAFDNYQAFLTVYSNVLGNEPLTVKLWNANEGQVYTNVTPAISFTANAVHGTPSNPVIFESTGNVLENNVDLPKGWKWISFNLTSNEMKLVDNIVKTNGDEGDLIKGKEFYDTYSATQGWVGSITQNGGLNNQEMYKAFMHASHQFNYSGSFAQDLSVAIVAGWNWIGFIARFNMNINEAMVSLDASSGDLIKGQHSFATYEPAMGWIGSLTFMKPGEGYMLKSQHAGTLTYPKISALGGRMNSDDTTPAETIWKFDPYAYADNMNAIAGVSFADGKTIGEDDLLGAFADGACVGIAKPVFNPLTKTFAFFLTISGDAESRNIHFRYYKHAEKTEYVVNETFIYQSNVLKGTLQSPVLLTIDEQTGEGISIYPNPFNKEIAFNLRLIGDAEVRMEIADLSGRTIRPMQPISAIKGITTVTWDGKDSQGVTVSGGVYMLRISVNGVISNYRIIKL